MLAAAEKKVLENKVAQLEESLTAYVSHDQIQAMSESAAAASVEADVSEAPAKVANEEPVEHHTASKFVDATVRAIFRRYDSNSNGSIERAELRAVLQDVGVDMSEEQADYIGQPVNGPYSFSRTTK